MNLQIKTFPGLECGNYVIAIACTTVAIPTLKHIFDKVIAETQSLPDCKVLIDFQDSRLQIAPSDVAEFLESINRETWPHNSKVALVSAQKIDQYRQAAMLGQGFRQQSFNVGVFHVTEEAIIWLSNSQ